MSVDITQLPKLFEGYIETISANVGYGADGSACQISLVFENDGPLRPFDIDDNFPELGTAIGIKWGAFEFGGIFQRYTHKRSLSGYKYDVIIESPSKWLDGIQIILDGFQGTTFSAVDHIHPQDNVSLSNNKFAPSQSNYIFTNNINNVWNPFAILENYQYVDMPSGIRGNFGNSDVNSAGFPAKKALQLIEEISRGEHAFGGKAIFGESEYEVDLSELIAIVPDFFRVKGPSQSLNAIIQECCEIASHDYIVFIQPKSGVFTTGIIVDPVIKIKVISKKEQPDPTVIKRLINQYEKEQKLISADFGKEFSDAVTQKLVIGGAASRHWTNLEPYEFYPIWGKTQEIKPRWIIGNDSVAAGGLDLFAPVQIALSDGSMYEATVLEIRCAISSFDSWVLYKALTGDAIVAAYSKLRWDEFTLRGLLEGSITVQQLFQTGLGADEAYQEYYKGRDPLINSGIHQLYENVKAIGDQYYGRRFFVPLPFEPGGIDNNIKFINEDQQYITAWQVAQSAWVDSKLFQDINFYDGDGRLLPVAVWPRNDRYDYSGLKNEYVLGLRGIGSIVNADQQIYWQQVGPFALPYCIVETPEVLYLDQYTTNKLGSGILLKLLQNIDVDPAYILNFGTEDGPSGFSISPAKVAPSFISVPQESTRYTWGPWWKYTSKKGKAEVLIEDTLKPETFGSSQILNSVGYDFAFVSSNVTENESGYIELAEQPAYNLAERFAVSGPYVTGIDITIAIDGIKTNYRFNTWTPQFGKLTKYNADRISRINKNRIKFLQEIRKKFLNPPFPKRGVIDVISRFRTTYPQHFDHNFWFTVPVNVASGGGGGGGGANFDAATFNGGGATFDSVSESSSFSSQSSTNASRTFYAVAPQDIRNTLINLSGDNRRYSAFGCSPEQILTPVRVEKNDQTANPKNYNPYFAFSDGGEIQNDFIHAMLEGEDIRTLDMQENKDRVSAVRGMGIRGPIMLSGWGYDTNLRPVPVGNTVDTFADDAIKDRSMWKTGPVDLRWDESRGVWQSGFELVEGFLITSIARGSPFIPAPFNITVTGTNALDIEFAQTVTVHNLDPSLQIIYDEKIHKSKIFIVAIRMARNFAVNELPNTWRPIWVGCPDTLQGATGPSGGSS
jgi:hypothetical protein